MKWCDILNMFCSDIENEEIEISECDGKCDECDYCSEVKQ